MTTIPSQRHLFDVPEDVAYFNSAYNSPLLNESRQRLIEGAGFKSRPWDRTPDNFFEDANTIRRLSSQLFGGQPDGYAVIPSTSYGISTAARAIEPMLGPGDRILLLDEEFPSNVLPWRRVSLETGAKITTIPRPLDDNWAEAILKGINRKVKVVAVSTCHWTNGVRIDIDRVGKACRQHDIMLVVDGTQTLGAMPFCVDRTKPDFLVASGYKWMLCPYGFSLMYVSENWRNCRPLEETWLARENAHDFAGLVNYSDTYMPGARRFDVGQTCTATVLPGAIAALAQIRSWGVERIEKTLAQINEKISGHLETLGFTMPDNAVRCAHMFGTRLPGTFQGSVIRHLAAQKIYVSQRGDSLRFAPHMHITDYDVDRLVEALKDFLKKDGT